MRSTKVSPGLTRHAHHDPVGQHARAAGDGREVAARFADHRRRFAGDGALVDRGHAFDDLAVGGHGVAGLDQDHVALAQLARGHAAPGRPVRAGIASFLAEVCFFRPRSDAACALLRPSASASAKLANSTVNHSQNATARMNPAGASPLPRQGLQPQHRGEDAAAVDDEHHRVAPLLARMELAQRIDDGRAQQRRVEECGFLACHGVGFRKFGWGPPQFAWGSIRCSTTGPRASAGT